MDDFRAVVPFYVTLQWWICDIMQLSKTHKTAEHSEPKCRLRILGAEYQYWFINSNKGIALLQDVKRRETEVGMNFVFSAQVF
jgi:hypothetical protein